MTQRRKKSKSVVDTSEYKYGVTKIRDAEGKLRHSAGNGDAVAKAMLGLDHKEIQSVAKENDLKVKPSGNNGLFRMSVGHALRGLVRNGTSVKIGKTTVKTLSQKVTVPKAIAA